MNILPVRQLLSVFVLICLSFSSCDKQPIAEELSIDVQETTNDLRSNTNSVDVYIMIGQSNSNGGGHANTIGSYNPALVTPYSPVLMAGRKSTKHWNNSVHLLPWGALRARHASNSGFGCELSMGRRLQQHVPDYKNNVRKVAIIKCGTGSTTLLPSSKNDYWDGSLITRSLTYINGRINGLKNIGYTDIQIKGVIWNQGGSDVKQHPHLLNQYPGKFVQMINKISNKFQNTQNMKVIMVGLNQSAGHWTSNPTKLANLKIFNKKLIDLANARTDYHYVSADKLEMQSPTNGHYNGAGNILLGFRVARKFY